MKPINWILLVSIFGLILGQSASALESAANPGTAASVVPNLLEACTLTTTPFSVCPGIAVDATTILEYVDTSDCAGTPLVKIDQAAKTYTVTCTNADGCTCTGTGYWTEYGACTLTTTPFSVCPGIAVDATTILEYVDTSDCAGTPLVKIDQAAKTYTVTCTNADGCTCTGTGYWTEDPGICISGSKTNGCTGEGLAGWTIELYGLTGTLIDTKITDSNGEYSFCGLAPGTYTVCETPQAGWVPVGPTCIPVTLVDDDVFDIDFRNAPLRCIKGTKVNDCTGEGLEGWEITLKDEAGIEVDRTTTDADGDYSFCGLEPGRYQVCEVPMDGWVPVGDDCIDVVLDCENSEDNDFRNAPLLCIEGYKLNYEDNLGIPGWVITLKDEAGNVVGTTTTDAAGKYQFCNLGSGTYTICEEERAGWEPVGETCITVIPNCEDSIDNNFYNDPNHCPVTEDTSYDTAKNTPITVSHAGTDEDSDPLTVATKTQPEHGAVVLNPDGTFTYTQTDHSFCGEDSFTYTVSDGKCDPVLGTITIDIECPQDAAPGQTGENPGLSGDTGKGHNTIPGHTK